jgi:hypothetical protein
VGRSEAETHHFQINVIVFLIGGSVVGFTSFYPPYLTEVYSIIGDKVTLIFKGIIASY